MDKTTEPITNELLLAKIEELKEDVADSKTSVIALILLIVAYPIGFFYMWGWTNWSIKLKIFLSLPVLLFFLIFFSMGSIVNIISELVFKGIPTPTSTPLQMLKGF